MLSSIPSHEKYIVPSEAMLNAILTAIEWRVTFESPLNVSKPVGSVRWDLRRSEMNRPTSNTHSTRVVPLRTVPLHPAIEF